MADGCKNNFLNRYSLLLTSVSIRFEGLSLHSIILLDALGTGKLAG